MRILLTTSLYPTPAAPFTLGGAEIFAKRLSEQLVADGHELEVVRAHPRGYAGDEAVNGVVVRSVGRNNLFLPYGETKNALVRAAWHVIDDHVRASRLLEERIRAFRPDVMHSNTLAGLGADIWRVARAHDVPIVHTLHDYYLTCPRCARFKGGQICSNTCQSCRLLTSGRRDRVRHVSAVVGVSRRILAIHQQEGLFLNTPIQTVVRNASHLVEAVEPEAASPALRVGFMGRITIDKGVDRLISALSGLPQGQVRMIVAGRIDDAGANALRALAPDADIRFLGFVRPQDFFRQVDIVVVPSIWEEPGSLVIEETLAAGRPVIVSSYGGSPEAVEPGVTGWVVTPDIGPLRELIASIAAQPDMVRGMQRRLMRDTAHRTMRDVANGYADVYRQAAEPPLRASA